jgi:hypothetical protein
MALATSAYREAGGAPPVAPAAFPPARALAPGTGEKLVTAASTTGKPLTRPELGVVAVMTAAALIAYVISAWFVADDSSSSSSFRPAEGVTVFAVFYVLAQAIERLLTPIAKLVPTSAPDDAPDEAKVLGGLTTRSRALKQRTAAVEECADTSDPPVGVNAEEVAKQQAERAANWHEILQQTQVNAATVWALGAAFAFVLCAWLNVYLLNAIGVASWDPPTSIDLLVTGLAIGGGTKPLHDLIDRIQKPAATQAENETTGPTAGGGRAGVVPSVPTR